MVFCESYVYYIKIKYLRHLQPTTLQIQYKIPK